MEYVMKSLKLKDIIKENDELVDKKVQTAVKKMKELCIEKADYISALIELAKLVEHKGYTNILNSIKDINKEYDKFEDELIIAHDHYLEKYIDSIKMALFVHAKIKFNNKELSLLTSCF